ncbi:MAG TPA: energy-coupling factor transporter transmembrane component T [Propionibacteriaceae bacterium]|nr:energy-coupling factor transporter transmembrane component T [Propionibacteriaceae bacterium]
MSRPIRALDPGPHHLPTAPPRVRPRVRRGLHPGAWWGWAGGAAVSATLTRNPLLLALIVVALAYVVVARRGAAPWARSLRVYAVLALAILAIRLVFQVLVGGLREGHVLVRLPQIVLPSWAAGVQIGGPVTVEALWFTVCDAGRLATLVWCVGAANSLANPRGLLRSLPHAAHRLATAVAIAVSSAPQLVESTQRVGRARRLRGGRSTRAHAGRGLVVPVLEDALERSLSLAASMESRGFGSQARPTCYRAQPWRPAETLTVAAGVLAAVVTVAQRVADPASVWPPASPISWPALPPALVLVAVLLVLPGFLAPLPDEDRA